MSRNFFFELVSVKKFLDLGFNSESTMYQSKSDFEFAVHVFGELVACLEDCAFSKSDVTAFVCRNWSLDLKELLVQWEVEFGVKKSESAMRSQLSTTSRQLHYIFGENLQDIFVSNRHDDLVILLDEVNVIQNGDFVMTELVIPEVMSYCADYKKSEGVYPLSECVNELKAMSILSRRRVFDFLDTLDEDKLRYLARSLQKPLLDVSTRSVQKDKLQVLRALYEVDADSFYSLENLGATNEVNTEDVKNNSEVVEVNTDFVTEDDSAIRQGTLRSDINMVLKEHANGGTASDGDEGKASKLFNMLLSMSYADKFSHFLDNFTADEVALAIEMFEKSSDVS